jgi:hypothetical protein
MASKTIPQPDAGSIDNFVERYSAFDDETVKLFRKIMLWGLASYGELQRLQNQVQIHEASRREIPAGLRVIEPTGNADAVGEFAEALAMLDEGEPLQCDESGWGRRES